MVLGGVAYPPGAPPAWAWLAWEGSECRELYEGTPVGKGGAPWCCTGTCCCGYTPTTPGACGLGGLSSSSSPPKGLPEGARCGGGAAPPGCAWAAAAAKGGPGAFAKAEPSSNPMRGGADAATGASNASTMGGGVGSHRSMRLPTAGAAAVVIVVVPPAPAPPAPAAARPLMTHWGWGAPHNEVSCCFGNWQGGEGGGRGQGHTCTPNCKHRHEEIPPQEI